MHARIEGSEIAFPRPKDRDLPRDTETGRCKCVQRWCSVASDTQSWRPLCKPISVQTQPEHIDPSQIKLVPNEVTQQLATNLRKPRCLQELLGRTGAKVEEVWRPQTQDPGVHFVPLLGRAGNMQIRSSEQASALCDFKSNSLTLGLKRRSPI